MSVRYFRQSGATLIELIVFIVIVSVALVGVLSVLNLTVKSSADPVQPKQALAIAEGMLEEVLLKGYCDPDTVDLITTAPIPACGAKATEATRALYDDVDDYDGFHLANATTVIGSYAATGYAVDVSVAAPAMVNGQLVKEVRVTVTPPNGSAIVLYGYRANY
ncbi:MAG: prepilin-type N-terminal cleavage/methylation domain-containing protein [Sulfuritalea sp.]|nr:prepilin-type N-terminal cleavage/methylation domain-containing protein [Sulfuritalea sp.]